MLREPIDPGYAPTVTERHRSAFAADADQALERIAALLSEADTLIVAAHDAGYLTQDEYEDTAPMEDVAAIIDAARMRREAGE